MKVEKRVLLAMVAAAIFASTAAMAGLFDRKENKAQDKKPGIESEASGYYADETTRKCIGCHEKEKIAGTVSLQWKQSLHGEMGVGCLACHEAGESDPDAWKHEGYLVSHIPTPKDCATCHEKEVKEFEASHHAKAAQFIGSLDNILGEVVEGGPAANMGCKQCHGSRVKLDTAGVPVTGAWPNTGIGRINPDGSRGSCTACHTRHMFSRKQAREPRTCGRCHMGPDHPQIEIYEESKHGIMFAAYRDEMSLDSIEWVVGKDYSAAPTCSTCHMSATPGMEVTHDVGERISWTLRPPISGKQENWEEKRGRMKSVCYECHAKTWADNYFVMFDDAVELYNRKFAEPATSIMKKLREAGKITPTPFDDEIEWTYFELWHHEGRRARMGASMMGPDFTQWHGFYEVAKHFYNKFLPRAEKLMPGVGEEVMNMPEHQWKKGMTPEQIEKMLKFYRERYGRKVR